MFIHRRASRAANIRRQAAEVIETTAMPNHVSNGEEDRFGNYITSFTKGLPHNDIGEVDPEAFNALRRALHEADFDQIEDVPLGNISPCAEHRGFVSPLAGVAFDLEGCDAQSHTIPPAPKINSAEHSAEMVELYWMALLRDVPFADYADNLLVDEACEDLSILSDFRGPFSDGSVTPDSIFRGVTPGDEIGPYVSQFLLKEIPYGTLTIDQRSLTPKKPVDYLVTMDDWLGVQRGEVRSGPKLTQRAYLHDLRGMAEYVHRDALYQAYLNACLILIGQKAPVDPGLAYAASDRQQGFATFGDAHILSLVTEVATRALKAQWFQKWFVHRRFRPEAFGGRINAHLKGDATYPIDAEVLESQALQRIQQQSGAGLALLPQAFPEGSPMHPSYGAGHATVAGACVTILKAWFDESHRLDNPVVASADGQKLEPYQREDADQLTVGGELNKLASNISLARNAAGVHWRSDYTESILLGEKVAISLLKDQKPTYGEPHFMSFTRFDGHRQEI